MSFTVTQIRTLNQIQIWVAENTTLIGRNVATIEDAARAFCCRCIVEDLAMSHNYDSLAKMMAFGAQPVSDDVLQEWLNELWCSWDKAYERFVDMNPDGEPPDFGTLIINRLEKYFKTEDYARGN